MNQNFGDNDLKQEIEQDLKHESNENIQAKFSTFEKMPVQNLAKQDRKLLLQFCHERGLLKSFSDRQILKLNRLELAKIIRPAKQKTNEKQTEEETKSINYIDIYKNAFMGASKGDYSHLDSLALMNVNSLLTDDLLPDTLTEETSKKLKFVTSGISGLYLIIRFTGGFTAWKNRVLTSINFLRKRVKKSNV